MPLVEDFPLAPEEETPDFFHLTMTLQWRAVRAWEHWRGNTHLTLADIIHRTVEQGIAAGTIQDMPWPSGAVPSKKSKPLPPARKTKRLRRASIGSTLESLFDELGEGEEFRLAVREKVRSLDTAPSTAAAKPRPRRRG